MSESYAVYQGTTQLTEPMTFADAMAWADEQADGDFPNDLEVRPTTDGGQG